MNLKKNKKTFNCNIAEKHKKTSKQLPLKKKQQQKQVTTTSKPN